MMRLALVLALALGAGACKQTGTASVKDEGDAGAAPQPSPDAAPQPSPGAAPAAAPVAPPPPSADAAADATELLAHGGRFSATGDYVAGADPVYPEAAPKVGVALAGPEPTPYMKDCAKQGVPLPPVWGDDAWKLEGALAPDKLLTALTGRTELFTFTPAEGVCAALPRYNGKGEVTFLGVICANKTTGKTCFFDNVDPDDRELEDKLPVAKGYSVASGLGGDKLKENCTNCHRGDNPWVVVPGQPTAKLTKIVDKVYVPIGGFVGGWTNPLADKSPVPACDGCHTLPRLSKGFCEIGLKLIEKKLMPRSGTAGQAEFKLACRDYGFAY